MANERDFGSDGGTHELLQRRVPRQIVVGAHRTAHRRNAREATRVSGDAFPAIERDEPPRQAARVEPFGKMARALGRREAKDGYGAHGRRIYPA